MSSTTFLNPTTASFEQDVLKEGAVLVEFWAPWCGPCRAFKPIVEAVVGARSTGLRAAFVNIDENPDLAVQYDIRSIPALRLFKNGEVVDAHVGVQSKAELEAWLERNGV